MSNEDIMLLVQELPLNVMLTLKRNGKGNNNLSLSSNKPFSPIPESRSIDFHNETFCNGHITPNKASAKVTLK
jgi:hypothetical protein